MLLFNVAFFGVLSVTALLMFGLSMFLQQFIACISFYGCISRYHTMHDFIRNVHTYRFSVIKWIKLCLVDEFNRHFIFTIQIIKQLESFQLGIVSFGRKYMYEMVVTP